MDKDLELKKSIEEFNNIINDLTQNETVLQMKNFRQHYNTSCFDHCKEVAFYSYLICKKLNLDYVSAARAGMLHDLFLYDWRKRERGRKGLHAYTHGKTAFKKASEILNLNDKEKDMIIKHMWPVTLAIPKYKETFILTFVDKYFAIAEAFIKIKEKKNEIKEEKEKIIK